MTETAQNPEIGQTINAGGITTNYHVVGNGEPVVLIHGSGPGVTGWANWRLTLPALAEQFRVYAPDMVGFGYTERPEGTEYGMSTWLQHLSDFVDAIGEQQIHLVGNSFGGALALVFAIRYPHRIKRLVLMGSVGVPFELTEGLDQVWGYTPSFENMKAIMGYFAYDQSLMSDDLAELRYRASIRPGYQESFASMFPAPRQRWVDAMASREADIQALDLETLIVHGRDDRVIPLATSLRLAELIDRSQLHVFGRCGHWTQIEHAARFNRLVCDFLTER